jgi:hypothetical protein
MNPVPAPRSPENVAPERRQQGASISRTDRATAQANGKTARGESLEKIFELMREKELAARAAGAAHIISGEGESSNSEHGFARPPQVLPPG